MGYDRYTVPDTVAVERTVSAFLKHSQTYVHGLSCHSFNFLSRTVNSKPPTIPFGIVHFFPTIFLEIAVVSFNYSYCSGGSRGGVWISHCSVKQFLASYNYDVGFPSENKNLLEKNLNILKLL